MDWYINASIHVACATAALVGITNYYSELEFDLGILLFVFCSTMSSYNIIKYAGYVVRHHHFKKTLKAILGFTVLGLLVCGYYFFTFQFSTQVAIAVFGLLNVLYVIPLGEGKSNLRNLAGIKIYIVSICWAGVTLLLPLLEAGESITQDIVLKFIQRFILTLILILIFEINDLKYDDERLKTLPQTIGVANTKRLIYALSGIFFVLDFLKEGTYPHQTVVNSILVAVMVLLTYFVHKNRSKYYTLFWAESVPVLWYALIILFNFFG